LNTNYNNYNNVNQSSLINENFEDLKLFENCGRSSNKKNLIETSKTNNNYNTYINHSKNNSKYANTKNSYNNNNNENSVIKQKPSFMDNTILNKKLAEERNFENTQIGKMLKKLQNFDDIDEKIKFGYISVVPKTSLLYVNENKFLSYKELKKDFNRKEKIKHLKLQESSLRSINNPTPFQNFETSKNILREKIKFQKDIYAYQKTLMNDVIDAGENKQGIFILLS